MVSHWDFCSERSGKFAQKAPGGGSGQGRGWEGRAQQQNARLQQAELPPTNEEIIRRAKKPLQLFLCHKTPRTAGDFQQIFLQSPEELSKDCGLWVHKGTELCAAKSLQPAQWAGGFKGLRELHPSPGATAAHVIADSARDVGDAWWLMHDAS